MAENELDLRLAVLIDADNASRTAMKDVMAEVAVYGTPTIKRIYGDWTTPNMASWKPILLENAITPIQQYSYTTGKNATDSAMIIDAMDILYSGNCDGFVLVSSDSDFTRLAIRLREAGKKVIGMGEKKTPSPFIVACDKFIYIEVIRAAARKAAAQQAANRSKKGYVGVFVRDAKAQGVHQLSSAALIPTELGQENQNYIRRAFTGSDRGGPSKVVAVVIATGTEDTTALEAGLKSIEGLTLDYLAGPPDATAAELTALEKWVKDRRAAYFTEKLVEPNAAKAPDDMGIIDFAETDGAIAEGAATYTAGQYASRIAGVLAGIPAGMSATYAPLTELTAVTPRSTQEQEAAIKAGKLILIHDGVKAKIARGVNSLTTIPATGKADWSKIKIVEGMDLLTYYLRTTIQDEYVGRYANTYDNKCVLVTAIQTFLAELEGQGVLSSGESWAELDTEAQERWMRSQGIETADMTAQEIREYQTGSWVFVRVGGRFVDAMEDFHITLEAQ